MSHPAHSLLLALALVTSQTLADIKVVPRLADEPLVFSTFWSAIFTTGPFIATTAFSQGTSEDLHRKVRAARDDAAAYIASAGQIRGPYLESALETLRQDSRWGEMDDQSLVQAILVAPSS